MELQKKQLKLANKYSFILLFILFATFSQAHSNDEQRVSQSLGGLVSAKTKISKEMVNSVEPEYNPSIILKGTRNDVINIVQSQQHNYIGNSLTEGNVVNRHVTHTFSVYDATVNLITDNDYDHYYQYFNMSFDANVSNGSALVYARLYLSYEGGPWNLFYTTQNFTIFSNDISDTYEVSTGLSTGYPTGSYDILIELHEQDWSGIVASYGPNEDIDLYNLPLEDADHDVVYDSYDSGGGCSIMPSAKFDPVFLFLVLFSMLYFLRAAWKKYTR